MATYGSIQDTITSLLSRSDLSSIIPTAVQHAILHYERSPFFFNEARVSFTVSSAKTEYTLSASFVQELAVIVTLNGTNYLLSRLTEQERLDLDSSNATGVPLHYSIFSDKFIPYPRPNQTYTVEITQTKRLATLSASTDSNAWTNYAAELIENRALWWLHAFKTRNQELAQMHKQAEMEALSKLDRENSARVSSGRVVPTQF